MKLILRGAAYRSMWIGVLVLLFVGSLVVLQAVEEDEKLLPGPVEVLTDTLKLSDEQVVTLGGILNATESQESLDHQNFKGNGLALVEAAKRRQVMTDSRIGDMLDDEQKEAFREFKAERNRELFMLAQGLLLDEKQVFLVKCLLDDYNARIDAMASRIKGRMRNRNKDDGGVQVGMGGGRGGGMSGGRGGGGKGGGGMRGGGRSGFDPMQMMKDLDAQKMKKIKEHLSKEQKKVLKQIDDAREREFMHGVRKKMKEARGQ